MNKLTDKEKAKIKEVISDKLGFHIEDISDNSHLQNDLGTDSLDEIELVMEFEKEFNILIPDDLAEKVVTVADVFTCVEEARNLELKNK